jgi:hypothetical protein
MNWRGLLITPCSKTPTVGRCILSVVALVFLVTGCNEETTRPEDDSLVLPELTTPENVISALQVVYNDKTHSKEDRLAGYASLLDSAFIFNFQESDVVYGAPANWGVEEELVAHQSIFDAHSTGDLYSIELRITHDPAEDLSPPESGRDGWQGIFATNVYLRLMFNLEDGLEVNGGQAEFKFPPAESGRFRIGDWTDLPRPAGNRSAVEGSTWGGFKYAFFRSPSPARIETALEAR